MNTERYNLHMQSGETFAKQFQLLAADGNPYDLTNYRLESKIKTDYTSSTAVATFNVKSDNPETGIFSLLLDSGSSTALSGACYYYDMRIITGSTVIYPLEGKVVVSPSVTKN